LQRVEKGRVSLRHCQDVSARLHKIEKFPTTRRTGKTADPMRRSFKKKRASPGKIFPNFGLSWAFGREMGPEQARDRAVALLRDLFHGNLQHPNTGAYRPVTIRRHIATSPGIWFEKVWQHRASY